MNNNKPIIEKLAKQYDSFYIYDEKIILRQIQKLHAHFPGIDFLYSIKCNANPDVVKCILANGLGADAASAREVRAAAAAGLEKKDIFYSAPGKSMKDIEETMDSAVLIADSINEIARIQAASQKKGIVAEIGLRINPAFSFYGEHAAASKFGIDEAEAIAFLEKNDCDHVKVTGIHVHLKSQELNAEVLARYYGHVLQLAKRIQNANPAPLEFINMGSGMGIPYRETDAPLDMEMLGEKVKGLLTQFRAAFPTARVLIETGRFVTGQAGVYVTTVADRKRSCGKTYIILHNTLNGFIRPSLARLIAHYSADGSPKGSEPLFTDVDAFQFIPLKESAHMEKVDLVGNLCTAADVIAEDIWMPVLECGDAVMITNAGAYAAALSPMQFSSQGRIREFFVSVGDNTMQEAT